MLAAEEIRQVDDSRRLGVRRRRHDVVELADIAADDADLLAEFRVVRGLRVHVYADDFFAALGQERDEATADKPGAADDQDRHERFSSPGDALRRDLLAARLVPAHRCRNQEPGDASYAGARSK